MSRPFPRTRRIHMVGIGGMGMCGIAEVLLNLGYEVSGSDLSGSETTRRGDSESGEELCERSELGRKQYPGASRDLADVQCLCLDPVAGNDGRRKL